MIAPVASREALKGNAVRAENPPNAAAVPATVSGERDAYVRTGKDPSRQPLGRTLSHARPGKAMHQAMTHEPGDLPASGRSCPGPGDGRGTVNSV